MFECTALALGKPSIQGVSK